MAVRPNTSQGRWPAPFHGALGAAWSLLLRVDRGLTLRQKLLPPALAFVLVTVGGSCWLLQRDAEARIRSEYVEKGLLLSRSIAVSFLDEHAQTPQHLQTHIDHALGIEPSLLRVNLYRSEGPRTVIMASTDRALAGTPVDAWHMNPLSTGKTSTHEARIGDEKALEVVTGVPLEGRVTAGFHMSLVARDRALAAVQRRFLIIGGVGGVVSMALVYVLARQLVLARLQRIAEAGKRIAAGDYTARVALAGGPSSRDEFVILARSFDHMAASIEKLHRKLERQAITDGLTGLYNPRHLRTLLERETARARRLGYPLAALMIDVDRFKTFNDRHGHPAGDRTLRTVSRVLRSALRGSDIAARYGGEEFVALLPGCPPAAAEAVAEKIRLAVESTPVPSRGPEGHTHVTVSIGCAVYPDQASSGQELVSLADRAMYAAKAAGRNQVRTAA